MCMRAASCAARRADVSPAATGSARNAAALSASTTSSLLVESEVARARSSRPFVALLKWLATVRRDACSWMTLMLTVRSGGPAQLAA